jgi:hypothetical protein
VFILTIPALDRGGQPVSHKTVKFFDQGHAAAGIIILMVLINIVSMLYVRVLTRQRNEAMSYRLRNRAASQVRRAGCDPGLVFFRSIDGCHGFKTGWS